MNASDSRTLPVGCLPARASSRPRHWHVCQPGPANPLQKYKDSAPNKHHCWDCKGNHSWMVRGKLVCPRGTDPQTIKNAATKFTAYKASLKKGGKSRSDGSKPSGKRSIEFKDLEEHSQKKMHKTMLAMLVDGSLMLSMTLSVTLVPTSGSVSGPRVFMLSLPVPIFNITPPSRRVFPVPIQAAFLHITLQLGSVLGIRCVLDTAAVLTTGNLHFFAALAKAYPHTVTSIHSPKDYLPITLSGIVQPGGLFATTDCQ
jgi:hypothetical protein